MQFIGYCQLNQNLPISVVCKNGSGTPTTPDSTPTWKIYSRNFVDTITSGSLDASDFDSMTGFRKKFASITTAGGYTAGQIYVLVVTYTVSSTDYYEAFTFGVN